MYIVQSDGRARHWIKGFANTLRFSPAVRSPPLFDLSSPNKESLNQGDAAFSAMLMYSRWSAKPPGTGAGVVSRRYDDAAIRSLRVRSCTCISCIDEPGDRNRIKGLTLCEGSKIPVKLHNSVTETTDRGLYATLNRVQRIREAQQKISFDW